MKSLPGLLRSKAFVTGVILLFLPTIAVGGWLWWWSYRGWTKSKVERLINKELPVGSDRAQIESWFDRYGIEHRYTTNMADSNVGDQTMLEYAGFASEGVTAMVYGFMKGPDVNVSAVFSGELRIYVFLDGRGRLKRHYILEFGYTP